MMSDYQTILYEVSDHRATITLNRPDSLNGITNTNALTADGAADV